MTLFSLAQTIGKTLGQTQDIICADTVVLAKCNEMMNGKRMFAQFVFTVICLRGLKKFSNFLLGFVVIDS